MKIIIECDIDNIIIDDYYYSFDYKVVIGKKEYIGNYYNSHVWRKNKKKFKKILLEDGYALKLILDYI